MARSFEVVDSFWTIKLLVHQWRIYNTLHVQYALLIGSKLATGPLLSILGYD